MLWNNFVIRSRNQQAFEYFSRYGRNERLHPLAKERAGDGVVLPGSSRNARRQAPLVPAVGVVVGAPFPTTITEFNALTSPQLNDLAIIFNDDFGIIRGDSIDDRRAKFKRFIAGL